MYQVSNTCLKEIVDKKHILKKKVLIKYDWGETPVTSFQSEK